MFEIKFEKELLKKLLEKESVDSHSNPKSELHSQQLNASTSSTKMKMKDEPISCVSECVYTISNSFILRPVRFGSL